MNDNKSVSELKAEALEAIELLSATIDELAEIANSIPETDAKRAQLREISRSIQELEKRNIPVPDGLRQLRTSIASELGPVDEAKEAIRETAKCLAETMRRLEGLGLTSRIKPKRRSRRSSSPTTSNSTLRELIIEALRSHGGRATRGEVLARIERRLRGQFTARDLETYSGRDKVWWNRASVERQNMVRERILKNDSPIGIWELAEGDGNAAS